LWCGCTAMLHQLANPSEARGGLAADSRATHVSDFPISENLKNHLSTQEK
jgi:hypothetical protein